MNVRCPDLNLTKNFSTGPTFKHPKLECLEMGYFQNKQSIRLKKYFSKQKLKSLGFFAEYNSSKVFFDNACLLLNLKGIKYGEKTDNIL